MIRKILKAMLYILLSAVILYILFIIVVKPSNDRDWSPDQEVLSYAEINGDEITIKNIRNFSYTSVSEYTPAYYDKTVNLSELKKVYYIVEPFSGAVGAAHTFVSFEFEGDQFVAISAEIRKQKGEIFSPFKGLFRKYELMYVIGDERDLIKLRTNYRKDQVYVYPVKASKEKAQALFVDMLERANSLKEKPEFYNTLTSTCTTNIVSHINKVSPERVPFSFKVLLPAYSDQYAHELGLIDTDHTLEEARKKYLVNERAEKYADAPDFSVKIRAAVEE